MGITETHLDLKQEIETSRTTLTTDLKEMTGTFVETLQKTADIQEKNQQKTQRVILAAFFLLFLLLMYIGMRVSTDSSAVRTEKTVFTK